MARVVPIKDAKAGSGNQDSGQKWWMRRLAAQLISQLPDDQTDALEILDEARALIQSPRTTLA
jgi:hypothetical protein